MRACHGCDTTHALVRFDSGVVGSIEANWAATGRTMDLSFEVIGTKGAICFSQERMNELLLFTGSGATAGFKRIESGPVHPPFGQFCPAVGHHLGLTISRSLKLPNSSKRMFPEEVAFLIFGKRFMFKKQLGYAKSARTRIWTSSDES